MKYTIKNTEAFDIIGISTKTNSMDTSNIDKLYQELGSSGELDKLCNLSESKIFLAASYDFEENNDFKYLIGAKTRKIDNEYEHIHVKNSKWLCFECTGKAPDSLKHMWMKLYKEFFPQNNEFSQNYELPALEIYSLGDINSDDYKCEIWIPIL